MGTCQKLMPFYADCALVGRNADFLEEFHRHLEVSFGTKKPSCLRTRWRILLQMIALEVVAVMPIQQLSFVNKFLG